MNFWKGLCSIPRTYIFPGILTWSLYISIILCIESFRSPCYTVNIEPLSSQAWLLTHHLVLSFCFQEGGSGFWHTRKFLQPNGSNVSFMVSLPHWYINVPLNLSQFFNLIFHVTFSFHLCGIWQIKVLFILIMFQQVSPHILLNSASFLHWLQILLSFLHIWLSWVLGPILRFSYFVSLIHSSNNHIIYNTVALKQMLTIVKHVPLPYAPVSKFPIFTKSFDQVSFSGNISSFPPTQISFWF